MQCRCQGHQAGPPRGQPKCLHPCVARHFTGALSNHPPICKWPSPNAATSTRGANLEGPIGMQEERDRIIKDALASGAFE